jgi:hypothetical protein
MVARPEGLEPPTLCLEVEVPNLSNLAGADVSSGKSTTCSKSGQTAYSFLFHTLLPFPPIAPTCMTFL